MQHIMKPAHGDVTYSQSSSCPLCMYKSESELSNSVIIPQGSEFDKLYLEKFIHLMERKLIEKLVRTQPLTESNLSISEKADLKPRNKKPLARSCRDLDDDEAEKNIIILELVHIVDKGATLRSRKQNECCNFRHYGSTILHEEEDRVHRHGRVHNSSRLSMISGHRAKDERCIGRHVRLKVKHIRSDPCTCPSKLNKSIKMESKPMVKKMHDIKLEPKFYRLFETFGVNQMISRKKLKVFKVKPVWMGETKTNYQTKLRQSKSRLTNKIESGSKKTLLKIRDFGQKVKNVLNIKEASLTKYIEDIGRKQLFTECECAFGCYPDDCVSDACLRCIKRKRLSKEQKKMYRRNTDMNKKIVATSSKSDVWVQAKNQQASGQLAKPESIRYKIQSYSKGTLTSRQSMPITAKLKQEVMDTATKRNKEINNIKNALLPPDCEPGTCVPGKCNPYECLELTNTKKHAKTRTRQSGTDQRKTKFINSILRALSMQVKTVKVQSTSSSQINAVVVHEREPVPPDTKSASENCYTQAVPIGKSNSFSIEFYKENSPSIRETSQIEQLLKPAAQKTDSKGQMSQDHIVKSCQEILTIQAEKKKKGVSVQSAMKRCFFTLYKMARRNNKIKLTSTSTKTILVKEEMYPRMQLPTKCTKNHKIERMVHKLQANECEPNFCNSATVIQFHVNQCWKRTKLLDKVKSKEFGAVTYYASRKRSTSSEAKKIKRSKDYVGQSYQKAKYRYNLAMNNSKILKKKSLSCQAIRIGSNFSVNAKFSTDPPSKIYNSKEFVSVRPSKMFNYNGENNRGNPGKQNCSQTLEIKMMNKTSGISPMFKRRFRTLKLQDNKNIKDLPTVIPVLVQSQTRCTQYREELNIFRQILSKQSDKYGTYASSFTLMFSSSYIINPNDSIAQKDFKSNRKNSRKNRSNYFKPLLKSKSFDEKYIHQSSQVRLNQYLKSSFYAMNIEVQNNQKKAYKLKSYKCEPGICVPGNCNPIQCKKLIAKRLMQSASTTTSTQKRSQSISSGTLHSKSKNQQVNKSLLPLEENDQDFKLKTLPVLDLKQVVCVGSTFNLDNEFSKYRTPIQQVFHGIKSKMAQRSSSTNTTLKRCKTRSTHSSRVKRQHSKSQSVLAMQHKVSNVAAELQRYYCNKKLSKKKRHIKAVDVKIIDNLIQNQDVVKNSDVRKTTIKNYIYSLTDHNPNKFKPNFKRRSARRSTKSLGSNIKPKTISASSMTSSQKEILKGRHVNIKEKPVKKYKAPIEEKVTKPSRVGSSVSFKLEFLKDKVFSNGAINMPINLPRKRQDHRQKKTQIDSNLINKSVQGSKPIGNQGCQGEVPAKHEKFTKTYSFIKSCLYTLKFQKKQDPDVGHNTKINEKGNNFFSVLKSLTPVKSKPNKVNSSASPKCQSQKAEIRLSYQTKTNNEKRDKRETRKVNLEKMSPTHTRSTSNQIISSKIPKQDSDVGHNTKINEKGNKRFFLPKYFSVLKYLTPVKSKPNKVNSSTSQKPQPQKAEIRLSYQTKTNNGKSDKREKTKVNLEKMTSTGTRSTSNQIISLKTSKSVTSQYKSQVRRHSVSEKRSGSPNMCSARIGSKISFEESLNTDKNRTWKNYPKAVKLINKAKHHRTAANDFFKKSPTAKVDVVNMKRTKLKPKTLKCGSSKSMHQKISTMTRKVRTKNQQTHTREAGDNLRIEKKQRSQSPTNSYEHVDRVSSKNSKPFNLEPYKCEPGICVSGKCNPYGCIKLIKRRQIRESSVSNERKPYNSEPYTCKPGICVTGKCNPYECIKLIKKRQNLDSSVGSNKSKTKIFECEPGVCVPGNCKPYKCIKRIKSRQNLETRVSSKDSKPYNLKSYECEPGLCVPGKCNPYQCKKIVRRRQIRESCSSNSKPYTSTEGLRFDLRYGICTRSTSSHIESSNTSKSKASQIKPAVKRHSISKKHSGSSNRSSLCIGSKHSFEEPFTKEKNPTWKNYPKAVKSINETKHPRAAHIEVLKNRCIAKVKGVMKRATLELRIRGSSKTMHQKKSTMTRKSRIKNRQTLTCEAGDNLRTEKKQPSKSPTNSYKQVDQVGSKNSKPYNSEPYTYKPGICEPGKCNPYECITLMKRRQTKASSVFSNSSKPYNLEPYECEPGICVPGNCNPYKCIKRIKKMQNLESRVGSKDSKTYNLEPCECDPGICVPGKCNPYGSIKLIKRRQKRESGTETVKQTSKSATTMKTDVRKKRDRNIQAVNRDVKTVSIQFLPVTRTSKSSQVLEKYDGQAVQIRSNLCFNNESLKIGTAGDNHTKLCSSASSKLKMTQGDKSVGHIDSQVMVKNVRPAASEQALFLKRCFSTLKLEEIEKMPNENVKMIETHNTKKLTKPVKTANNGAYSQSPQTHHKTQQPHIAQASKGSGILLEISFRTFPLHNTETNTITRVKSSSFQNKSIFTKNQRELIKKGLISLDTNYCEPGICIPGRCDPDKCIEILKRRSIHRQSKTFGISQQRRSQELMTTSSKTTGRSNGIQAKAVKIPTNNDQPHFSLNDPIKGVKYGSKFNFNNNTNISATFSANIAGFKKSNDSNTNYNSTEQTIKRNISKSQINKLKTENKTLNTGIALKKCFSTVELHKKKQKKNIVTIGRLDSFTMMSSKPTQYYVYRIKQYFDPESIPNKKLNVTVAMKINKQKSSDVKIHRNYDPEHLTNKSTK